MDLINVLKTGSPIVWVTTQDPYTAETIVLQHSKNKVYKYTDSLQIWDPTSKEYKLCLVERGPNVYAEWSNPLMPYAYIFGKMKDSGATIIVNDPVDLAKDNQSVFLEWAQRYLAAMEINDASALPSQFIMISATGDIPPELQGVVSHVTIDPPNQLQCSIAIQTFVEDHPDLLDDDIDNKDDYVMSLAGAVTGLNRTDVYDSLTSSILETGKLDRDFLEKRRQDRIKANCGLEIVETVSGFERLGGLDNLKELIQLAVDGWKNPEEFAKYGETVIRRILMVGVPGCGKSAICKATAHTFGYPLVKFGISQMMNKFIGESEANARRAFAAVNAMEPCVCWIDEFGRDASANGGYDGGTTSRTHAEFLTGLQELGQKTFLLAAANSIADLPPEMLRMGRFDHIVFIGFPTKSERRTIWNIYLGDNAKDHDVDLLAEKTPRWSGSEIESAVNNVRFKVGFRQKRPITDEDLLEEIATTKNRVWLQKQDQIVDMYKTALANFEWASSGQRDQAEKLIARVDPDAPSTTQMNLVGANS